MSEQGTQCIECGYGTYQNESNSVDCNVCPPNTNTTSTGTESGTLCRGKHSYLHVFDRYRVLSVFQSHFICFIQLVAAFNIKPIETIFVSNSIVTEYNSVKYTATINI